MERFFGGSSELSRSGYRCRCTANGSFASCITNPSITCVSTFGLIVALGIPPLSALLPVFGGKPPVDPVDGVVTQDDPEEDTVPLVESKPLGPMLLTGIADVPVTVAIAVVDIDDVAVEVAVVFDAPVVIVVVVVVVEGADDTVDVAVLKSFVVSSAELAVEAVAVAVEFWAAGTPLLTVVTEVGATEADTTEDTDTVVASDERGVDASALVPFELVAVVPVPGAGVVSIGVLAEPFNWPSDALSEASVPAVVVD